jgi:hypothetical protein
MAIRSIINFSDALTLAIGVNGRILADGNTEFDYCVLRRSGDIITVLEKEQDIRDSQTLIGKLRPFVDKGVRVHLNCIGKSVLSKVKIGQGLQTSGTDVQQMFPGIRTEDFVYQYFKRLDFQIMSLIRIADLDRAGLLLENSITSFSLGVCILESIGPVLPERRIGLEGCLIEFKNGKIGSIELLDVNTEVTESDNGPVPEKNLLAYASAFSLFVPVNDLTVHGLPEIVDENLKRYHAKRHLYKSSRLVILSLLILLSVNAVAFFWLNANVAEMEATLSLEVGKNSNDVIAQQKIQILKDAYEAMGWKTNTVPLFYADQIASTVPEAIQLNKIEEGTLDESLLRKERRYHFDSWNIKVQGSSADPAALSIWISTLKKLSWVSEISGQNYHFEQRLDKGIFEFSIAVKR